jgi:hypothetical protein
MRNIIREKRRLAFGYKRITPITIRSFSEIIENEINELQNDNNDSYYVMYSVDATDNTSFESQSHTIFDENQIIENRVVRKITMHFYTLDNSKNIEIQIVHSQNNENLENFILVSGDYPNWVNGILTRLSEIISLSEDQPKFNNRGYLIFVVWILFNIVYFRFTSDLINHSSANSWFPILSILGAPILSAILLTKLSNYVKSVWPTVELQTGPNYLQKPKESRKKAELIFLTIVIPLVLAFLYDVLKSNFS